MNLLKPHADEHIVSDGRVHCQKAGRDVSVEICWMCVRLIGFDVDEEMEIVRCTPERTLAEMAPAIP